MLYPLSYEGDTAAEASSPRRPHPPANLTG